MQKSKIEWTDYTINPVKGLCPMACPYCYARRMYKRFRWNPEVRYEPAAMVDLAAMPDGSKVFWGSTIELFGEWVPEYVMEQILEACEMMDNLTHIFLTKQPHNLAKWSPFPENCWVGVTATNAKMAEEAGFWLWEVKAKIKFVSFEPLLERIPLHFADYITESIEGIRWVIIGVQTPHSPKTAPRVEWVREITDVAKRAGIPVFHKNNLGDIFDADGFPMRQEFPTKIASGQKEGSLRA